MNFFPWRSLKETLYIWFFFFFNQTCVFCAHGFCCIAKFTPSHPYHVYIIESKKLATLASTVFLEWKKYVARHISAIKVRWYWEHWWPKLGHWCVPLKLVVWLILIIFLFLFFFWLCVQILGTGFVIIILNLGQRQPGDLRCILFIWKFVCSQFDNLW